MKCSAWKQRHMLPLAVLAALGLCAMSQSAQGQGRDARYTNTGYGHGGYYRPPCRKCRPSTEPVENGDTGDGRSPGDRRADDPDFDFSTAPSSPASGGAGYSSAMLGRADQSNRFNLFDTQSAIPRNRVWYTLNLTDGYNNGVNFTPGYNGLRNSPLFPAFLLGNGFANENAFLLATEGIGADMTFRREIYLHRFGVEVMLTHSTSLSFQGQYHAVRGVATRADDFDNPQIMLKQIIYDDCCSVLSATLGVDWQASKDTFVIGETTTRVYPGMLAYQDLGSDWFYQGGFQFGMPTETNQVYTFDWANSIGYWLYRPCGCCCCGMPGITGVSLQAEVYGKHVLNDSTINTPFGTNANNLLVSNAVGFPTGVFTFEEPRNVVDVTLGGQVLVGCNLSFAAGYSFPITGGEVRTEEFVFTTTYGY